MYLAKSFTIACLLSLFCLQNLKAQDSIARQENINNKRLKALSYTIAGGYAVSMTGLYFLWYDGYPQSNFHFFNDNNEWLKMDKIGHATTAYQVGRYGYDAFRWTGMPEKRAIWIGGSLGFAFLMTVEIFDGFSAEWGASTGDLVANTAGTTLFIGQQLLWKEQRITLKYSYHATKYRQYRPDLLGANGFQALLKDYNGQTYWLSVNPKSFLPDESRFPDWLDIALGYSAEGMTGAAENQTFYQGKSIPSFTRRPVYLISPDINLRKIKTRHKGLRFVLTALSFIKVPLPALSYDKTDKMKFHWLYF